MAELLDDAGEEVPCPANKESDGERPDLALDRLLHIGNCVIRSRKHRPGILQKLFAVVCESNAPVLPIEERNAEFRFEIANLLADGGLRHMENLRRAADAAVLGDG